MTLAQRAGQDDAARQAACEALLARVQSLGLEDLRVFWADVHGSYRSKCLMAQALPAALQDGVGMVSTLMLKDMSDRTAFQVFDARLPAALADFAGACNVLLLPDPHSLVPLPWAPQAAWLRAEPRWADGESVQADPRVVLQRALTELAEFEALGLRLQCGLEIEFHIYRITDQALTVEDAAWPAAPPAVQLLHPGYQLLSDAHADMAHHAMGIVKHTAQGLGLPLQSLEIELGHSQFEAVFAATDALTAADHLLMFRNAVRQALRRAGYHASFVCRPPFPNSVASGWHLHHSLVDASGRNVMQQHKPAHDALSELGAHWLAGLLAHAPGMTALAAPTLPAYSRYQGSVMAPQAANWGRDNRGTMLRVIADGRVGGDPSTRIENRLAEPLANPYLWMAAQVFAGLDGLRCQLPPGPASQNPYAANAKLLPATLDAALQALASDPVLQAGLGPTMAHVLAGIKQQELARHAQAEDKLLWARCEYFARF